MESSDKLTKRLSILRELRTVTGTMRGLSAVNIRNYENAASAVMEHDNVVDLGFRALAINGCDVPGRLSERLRNSPRLIILFGTDHGLCGRFNERVINHAFNFEFPMSDNSAQSLTGLLGLPGDSGSSQLLVVGQVAAEICTSRNIIAHATFTLPGIVDGIPELVHSLIIQIDALMPDNPDTQIDIFHHRSGKDSGIEVAHTSLLPVKRFRPITSNNWPTHNLPAISLTTDTLLSALIREHIFIGLYRACAESQAAEHISRLVSMQAACQNIDEQISDVDRRMRRQHQAAITSELMETIAGYESIAGSGVR